MIITNLLNEDSTSSLLQSLPIARIQQDCSEYLSNPTMLLRGSEDFRGEVIAHPTIRKDRRSLSGRYLGTLIFNEAFEIEFGVPRVRNECLFVTNNDQVARKYGDLYFILPENGSKLASREGVNDSIGIVGNCWYDFTDTLKQYFSKEEKLAFINKCTELQIGTPNIPDDWFDQLLNILTDANQDKAQAIMTKIQQRMMEAYTIENANSIRGSSSPIEYMLFNADRYWMIHADAVCDSVQISNYAQAWDAFTKKIRT